MPRSDRALVQLSPGVLVERDVLNIVEKIREYDPNLRVQYLDPDSGPEFNQAPYQIVEDCPDGVSRPVFSVWTLDETVLEKIYNADTKRVDVLLNLTTHNNAIRKERERRYQEIKDEDKDIITHVLKSPKGKYTFKNRDGKLVTIDDSQKSLPPESA